jgi:hypothetical protein
MSKEDAFCDAGLIKKLLNSFAVFKGSPAAPFVRGGVRKRGASEAGKVYEDDATVLSEELTKLSNRIKGAPPSV